MKKIIAVLLAVVLIAGVIGGFVYASNNSHPMTGQKLVGYGFFGTHELEEIGELEDATYDLHTMFTFTNPDCVSEITIDGVFILDRYGSVLYEGALLGDDGILEPHEVQAVELHDYLDLPRDIDPVTVEIFWTWTDKKGLPLIGWALTAYALFDKEGNLVETSIGENQMVNMKQKLKP